MIVESGRSVRSFHLLQLMGCSDFVDDFLWIVGSQVLEEWNPVWLHSPSDFFSLQWKTLTSFAGWHD